METMNHEFANNLTAGAIGPVCSEILMSIAAAQTAKDLHRIAKEEIMSTKVMDEAARLRLWDAVSRRFAALNAAAMGVKPDPRWG